MKVLDLLDEVEEICETSQVVPLLGKIIIDKSELLEIAKEIRQVLPDEIQQAQFIKDERQRILDEARHEAEIIVRDAEKQAEILVDEHQITEKAKLQSKELLRSTEDRCKTLKMGTFEYIDKILFDFQQQMELFENKYFGEMYSTLQDTFESIGSKLEENRSEIKDLAYRTRVEGEI
ncbi:MAG: ATPase [Clostridiales Family XIII bacterium]|jgi:vacuolar-type H+-ATPase subunit H|nr:ATPase [Clostridiales Family XIII bacterium]